MWRAASGDPEGDDRHEHQQRAEHREDEILEARPRALEGLPPGGTAEAPPDLLYTVTEIYPEHLVLDGNHPLAGIALRLSLRVQGVREATEEEIGAGSAGTGFFRIQPLHAQHPSGPALPTLH